MNLDKELKIAEVVSENIKAADIFLNPVQSGGGHSATRSVNQHCRRSKNYI